MYVEACVRVGDDAEVPTLGQTWFEAMVSQLPPGLWDQALAAGVSAERTMNGIWGSPLQPYGVIMTFGTSGTPMRFLRPKTIWPPRCDRLGVTQWGVEISLGQFDGQGFDAHAMGDVRGNAQREMAPTTRSVGG